jgi:predicted metal-dependent hydrolase
VSASATLESRRTIRLPSGTVEFLLRRSPRSRGLRATIDPRHGLVVSVPPAQRRGWAQPDDTIERFLREREAWVVRHLRRLDRDRAEHRARGGARDGGVVLYRGQPHRIRVVSGPPSARRSKVERAGTDAGDELLVVTAARDRRPIERVLEGWLRERAAVAVDRSIAVHAPALGVRPAIVDLRDPRSRWGSASKTGRLMLSWRLVLAPPDALETVVVHELAHLKVFGHGPTFWALVAARRPTHLADRAWLRRHSHALHTALEPVDALDEAV